MVLVLRTPSLAVGIIRMAKTNTNTMVRGGTRILHEYHSTAFYLQVISSECQCCLILVFRKLHFSHEVPGTLHSSLLGTCGFSTKN